MQIQYKKGIGYMNILMVSLGCDKNLCDSETMLGLLRADGYNITNDETQADVVIVNTCSFIRDAMEESINTILEMAELKEGRLKYLIVTGCLAERYKDEICEEIPEIDACLGTASFDRIISVLKELQAEQGNRVLVYDDINRLTAGFREKVITSGTFMGYLKIAEGCDKCCTYCIIPHIRGHYRSVPIEELVAQASYMAEQGISELVLVAQETTCYGVDLYGKKSLPDLIHRLGEIEGIRWIRLMYCYPEEITDEFISMFAGEPKLVHYIDMPLQHSEDSILRRMGRKTNKSSIVAVMEKLRRAVPDIAIRTTLIAGFPGETEEEHQSLLAFIDEAEFDRLGVFTYSREEGTPAAEFKEQVEEETAALWQQEIMELQQEVSLDRNLALVGTTMQVVIEGYSPEEDVYVGRTYRDAPGVDGLVFVNCDYELMSGSFVEVVIREAGPYDLIGDIKDEFTK